MRILCLHGYRQTTSSFYGRTSALRKVILFRIFTGRSAVEMKCGQALRHVARLEYLQGFYTVESTDELANDDEFGSNDDHGKSKRFCWWSEPSYIGWSSSVDRLIAHIQDEGPFDGVLGFSQGSALVCLTLALCFQKGICLRGLKFAMLYSGYLPSPPELPAWLSGTVALPSLHVWGESDAQVTASAPCSARCPLAVRRPISQTQTHTH